MELNKLILPLVSGAVTGYITNNYAVKMIFRKYGPFGGMIIATRQEFTARVSELVERDIINKQTIETELDRYEFRKAFYNLISEVLKKQIYINTPDIMFKEIPQIQESGRKVLNFCEAHFSTLAVELAPVVLGKIKGTDIIGEQQQLFLATKIQEIILEALASKQVFAAIGQGCYQEYQDKLLQEFISPEMFIKVSENLQELTGEFQEKLKLELSTEVLSIIEEVYRQLECEQSLMEFIVLISEKSFLEILGQTSCEQMAANLQETINKTWSTVVGKNMSLELARQLIGALQFIERPILSVLEADVQEKLTKYLQANLPALLEEIILWLKLNQVEIESLINQATDEVLATTKGDFFDWRSKIKKVLKENFTGNLAKQYSLFDYLLTKIKQDAEPQVLSQELSKLIIEYISRKNISQIISDLQQHNLLQPELISRLIHKSTEQYLLAMDKGFFEKLFSQKLVDLLPKELKMFLEKNLQQLMTKKLPAEFLFTPKLTSYWQKQIATKFDQLPHTTIKQAFQETTLINCGQLVQKRLLQNKSSYQLQLRGKLKEIIRQELEVADLSSVLTTDRLQQFSNNLRAWLRIFLNRELDNLQEQQLKSIYNKLNEDKDSVKTLTGFALDVSKKNLQLLLAGKIKVAVATNLSKMPDSEIQELVEDFMGKELKAINLFGAILGSMTGIGTFLVENSLMGNGSHIIKLFYATVVYGCVGYLTNIIALKMIFQPYIEKKIWGMVLPFTPGVVAKQKPRFAKSMARFVGENLLTPDSVQKLFQAKRQLLTEDFKAHIARENYIILEKLLNENSEFIARQLWQKLGQYTQQRSESIAVEVFDKLEKYAIQDFKSCALTTEDLSKVRQYLANSSRGITCDFAGVCQTNLPLGSVLPQIIQASVLDMLSCTVEQKIQTLEKILVDKEQGGKLAVTWLAGSKYKLEDSLYELLPAEQLKKLRTTSVIYLLKKLQKQENKISWIDFLAEKLNAQVKSKKKIGDLFAGKLLDAVQENSEVILQEILNGIQLKLENQSPQIKKITYQHFRQSSGPLLKGADLVLDIESDIYAIIDKLIYDKLPVFMQNKEQELQAILQGFFLNKVAPTPITTIGIAFNQQRVRALGLELLSQPQIQQGLELLATMLVDALLKIPVKNLLVGTKFKEFSEVYSLFWQESKQLRDALATKLTVKREIITEQAKNLSSVILNKTLWLFPVNRLVQGISSEVLEKNIEQLLSAILASKVFEVQLVEQAEKVSNSLQKITLKELLNSKLGQEDLALLLKKIVNDQHLTLDAEKNLQEQILILAREINGLVSSESKDFIMNIAIDSLVDGLAEHLLKIIAGLNIQQVTEREISNMEPQEIEEMFNSFAQPYFTQIANYGWLGGAVGILAKVLEKLISQIK